MALGSYPSRRYSRSWIAQRLLNRAPEWSHIRSFPISVGNQLLNPVGLDIQDTIQQLNRELLNSFISTADIRALDVLYRADLGVGMTFTYTENVAGERNYISPTVYATINSIENEISEAENNDINTLAYDCLPSRIEDSELLYTYEEIIPETTISNLSSVTPNSIVIDGPLYITLKNNSIWSKEAFNKIFYSKLLISGITRKGTTTTETIPLRYNGTFKTINEWKSISSVFAAYLSNTATITIETFPFNRESYLDKFNIFVPSSGPERTQFIRLGTQSWGSSFIAESFVLDTMDLVRDASVDDKEINYELELLDDENNNVSLVDFIQWPNSRFVYAIDNQYLYVYDVNLPYANGQNINSSFSPKIDLYSDRWVIPRGTEAQIKTRNLADLTVPTKVRWSVLDPDGIQYYMGLDGSLWPTTINAWIDNLSVEESIWNEQVIDFEITKNGEWIVTLEAEYYNNQTSEVSILRTDFLFFSPAITPEITLELPSNFINSTNISLDSDGNIWLLNYSGIRKLDIFFDYYIVDYENNRIWTKEDYSSVRIVLNES